MAVQISDSMLLLGHTIKTEQRTAYQVLMFKWHHQRQEI